MTKIEKWTAEAAVHGWTFVAQVGINHATYSRSVCGHEQQVAMADMRVGEVRCRQCKEQSWRDAAKAQGWTFVKRIGTDNAVYTHDACGHEQQTKTSAVKAGRIRCLFCKTKKWSDEARKQGWTFVAKFNKHHAICIHDACGHKQKLNVGATRDGRIACHGCGESWATKPSNLYLLDITTACGQRFLKLGIAQIVERRVARYGLAEGAKVRVLYAKAYTTGIQAYKVEKQLHKTVTTIPCVKRFKSAKKLMSSGHTECYEYSPETAGHLLLNLPN